MELLVYFTLKEKYSKVKKLRSRLEEMNKIIINHGELSRCIDLASSLHRTQRIETIRLK